MSDLSAARFNKELDEVSGIALGESSLTKTAEPRPAIRKKVFPSPDGESLAIQSPVLLPIMWGGEPRIFHEELRWEAQRGEGD